MFCPAMPSANRREGIIAQQLSSKRWQFPSLFSEMPCFFSYLLIVEGAVETFQNAQRFSHFSSYSFRPNLNWCDSHFKAQKAFAD
jgi:hypothetical protein